MIEGVYSRGRYMGRKGKFGKCKGIVKEFEREYGEEAEEVK